jgi:ribosomal protein S15P/S13E
MIEDLNLLADRYDALAEHLEAQNSDNSKVDGRSAAGQRSAED